MLFSDVGKKEVFDVKANKVGSLVDVDFDLATKTINYFVLKIGVFKKVSITPEKIDKIGEKVILKISKADTENPVSVVK